MAEWSKIALGAGPPPLRETRLGGEARRGKAKRGEEEVAGDLNL